MYNVYEQLQYYRSNYKSRSILEVSKEPNEGRCEAVQSILKFFCKHLVYNYMCNLINL